MLTGAASAEEVMGQAVPHNKQSTGAVTGTVFDPNGAVVSYTLIRIESSSLSVQIESDEEGRYRIELPVGSYRVTVKFPDIKPSFKYEEEDLQVVAGVIENLDIPLEYISFCECVDVSPSKEIIPIITPVHKRMAYRKIQ
jgi:hypothetical protein